MNTPNHHVIIDLEATCSDDGSLPREGTEALFCSWGNYDRNQFQRDARFHGGVLPLGQRHLNLKEEFSRQCGDRRRYGLGEALQVICAKGNLLGPLCGARCAP